MLLPRKRWYRHAFQGWGTFGSYSEQVSQRGNEEVAIHGGLDEEGKFQFLACLFDNRCMIRPASARLGKHSNI